MTLPAVRAAFRWSHESWGAALRCRPLEEIAPHLFTTRQLALSSQDGYSRLAESLNAHGVATVAQVHGANVEVIRTGTTRPLTHQRADAMVSNDRSTAIAVRAADCVPILMADRTTGSVAAVHAGWRGTAARVAVAALDALTRQFATKPADVVAAIGPSIGACCYEVGPELVDAFAAAGHERDLIDRWFSTPRPQGADLPRDRRSRQRLALHLDLPAANRDQLVLAGVPDAHIHLAGLCTAMHLERRERRTEVRRALRPTSRRCR
jgi:YfiH family protein